MPLNYHATLLADEVRTRAFLKALEKTISPGMQVLDIGTGSGILAFYAARLGARVTAVEIGEILDFARVVAESNGWDVRFLKGDFLKIDRTEFEAYDVIVSETIGNMMLDEEIVRIMSRAREMLKPGGKLIPFRLKAYAALAFSSVVEKALSFWEDRRYGIDFSILKEFMTNSYFWDSRQDADVLSRPFFIVEVDLYSAEPGRRENGGEFLVERDGTANAVLLWWEVELVPGVILDLAPEKTWPNQSWYRVLLPCGPLSVEAGKTIPFYYCYDERLGSGNVSWSVAGETRSAVFSAPLTAERRRRIFGVEPSPP
ncbi:MAG: class I SAM-dependent methyltransferase [Candidatus Hydrogenedentota bacterium]|nr:MAG: class I SAM-dependent methyltransferase [Candidatus Hydrogenedentota bacterium]